MSASCPHLTVQEQVKKGSFYTPARFVALVAHWLEKHGVDKRYTIFDPSCGYGAFFSLSVMLPENRYIGNDIDEVAVRNAKRAFPFIEYNNRNVFSKVSRRAYGIAPDERLCVVGNPPYNDVTSLVKNRMKAGATEEMDADVRTRDLGLSSLNVYAKLVPDYVAILHPLSYLIKRANFSAAQNFFSNYRIVESLVFSSQEFADTSRMSGFPILIALYERHPSSGLHYSDVRNLTFHTLEGASFRLADRDYVADRIDKYPTARRYHPEILFWTMRDINALRRSRTFIKERCANAVDVDPDKLAYYCYVDVFKSLAKTPYWMGNLDVPYLAERFESVARDFMALSKTLHPDIFGPVAKPGVVTFNRVQNYLDDVVRFSKEESHVHCQP